MDTKSGYCKINSYCQGQSIEKVANQRIFHTSQNFIKENLEGGLQQTEGIITREVFASLILAYAEASNYLGANAIVAAYAKIKGLNLSEIKKLSAAITKNLNGESYKEQFALTNKLLTFLTGEKDGANLTSSVQYLEGLDNNDWETLAEVFKKLEPGFVGYTEIVNLRKGKFITFADKLSSEYGVTPLEFLEGFKAVYGPKIRLWLSSLNVEDVKSLGVILAKAQKYGGINKEAIWENYATKGNFKTLMTSFLKNSQIDDFIEAFKDDEAILQNLLNTSEDDLKSFIALTQSFTGGKLITFLKTLNSNLQTLKTLYGGKGDLFSILKAGKTSGKSATEIFQLLGSQDLSSALIQSLKTSLEAEAVAKGVSVQELLDTLSEEQIAKLAGELGIDIGDGQGIIDLLKLLYGAEDLTADI